MVKCIESRMYPHTWWQCEFEGVVTHLAGDLVRTSTLESKNTGCSKLGTLLRSHLDQGPIAYVEGMALAMLVSLHDSLGLEVTQNGSGRYPFTPHAVNKLPHVLRTYIQWGIQIVNVRKNTAVKTAVQAKRRYVGMGNRSAIDRKFGDCQHVEPIKTLQGCHAQTLIDGLHRAFSLAISLRVEGGRIVKLEI